MLIPALLFLTMDNAAIAGPDAPANLRVEYLTSPLGIGKTNPRFSWEVRDSRQNARQSAYQIRLLADGNLIWDSGEVKSDHSAQIPYTGSPLAGMRRYEWQVRTWDGESRPGRWSGRVEFGTGPQSNTDWKGAWITDPASIPETVAASNGFHTPLQDRQDETQWVRFELNEDDAYDGITLFPSRPFDWKRDEPGFLFPLRYEVQASNNEDFSDAVTLVDQTAADVPNPKAEPLRYAFPLSNKRFVRLRVTKLAPHEDGKFGFTLAEMQLTNGETPIKPMAASASVSLESGAWSVSRITDGVLVSTKGSGIPALPPFHAAKTVEITKPVKRATLYATALGAYQVSWRDKDGKSVWDTTDILAPEWTDYHTRVQYQAYDLTRAIKPGRNTIQALIGDGWYAGRIGMSQNLDEQHRERGVYGRRPQFLAQVKVEYTDGSSDLIATGSDWAITRDTGIAYSDIYDGESQGFPEKSEAVAARASAVGESPRIVAQANEPIRVEMTIKPIAKTEPKPGIQIFDMGQNMVGWVRIRCKSGSEKPVQIRHAEVLNDDGTLYTDNLRGAPQIDRFIPAALPNGVFEPHFTYHGFRFLEITGDVDIAVGDVEGKVFHSDSPIAGSFESSDPLLNQIWKNVLWTQRANLMSTPTDCPQRDERLGWMGDILVFGQAACYNMDLAGFYTKWLTDVRDAQADDGRMADIVPHPYGRNRFFTGAPGWGDAGVVVPWRAYENYLDRDILADNYDSSCRWVDFIYRNNPNFLWQKNRGNNYNDWLNGDSLIAEGWPRKGGEVPHDVFATIMFYNSTRLVERMATILGHAADAKRYGDLADNIQKAFMANYLAADGTITGDTQAGYSLALFYGIVPADRHDAVFNKMVAALEKYHGKMSTGFHSSHALMIELSRNGRSDLAYRLAQSREFPSWGYSVEQGSTTIWERWDGYVKGRGFQDPGMNSFNHWAFGAVTEWLMRTVAGLNPGESGDGWIRPVIQPIPGGGLTHARGTYRSLYGEYVSDWRIENGTFRLQVKVPANTTANVRLPDGRNLVVGGGNWSWECPAPSR